MLVYTIRKGDLYKSGIEPNCNILDSSGENDHPEYAHILAQILMELLSNSGDRT